MDEERFAVTLYLQTASDMLRKHVLIDLGLGQKDLIEVAKMLQLEAFNNTRNS